MDFNVFFYFNVRIEIRRFHYSNQALQDICVGQTDMGHGIVYSQ